MKPIILSLLLAVSASADWEQYDLDAYNQDRQTQRYVQDLEDEVEILRSQQATVIISRGVSKSVQVITAGRIIDQR